MKRLQIIQLIIKTYPVNSKTDLFNFVGQSAFQNPGRLSIRVFSGLVHNHNVHHDPAFRFQTI